MTAMALISQQANGYEFAQGSHINGFAHHTLLWSDNNDFIVDTDDKINHAVTDIGITLNHRANRYWHFSAQINSHKAGETSDGDIDLDFAYLQWHLFNTHRQKLSLLAGRVVMRYGLFNEIRDVTHSRSSIFVPYSIYYDRFRSIVFSQDGIAFDYKYFKGFDHIRIEGAYTTPRGSKEEIAEVLPTQYQNGKSDGQEAYYFRASYEQPLRARYMVSGVYLRWDYQGELVNTNPLSSAFLPLIPVKGGFDLGSMGVSTQQFIHHYTLTIELFRHHASYRDLLPTGDFKVDLNAAYAQLQMPCGPIMCMAQYEMLESLESDMAPSSKTEDIGIGIAWQFNHDLLLRAELHKIDGTAWLRNPTTARHKNWTYASTQIAWKF